MIGSLSILTCFYALIFLPSKVNSTSSHFLVGTFLFMVGLVQYFWVTASAVDRTWIYGWYSTSLWLEESNDRTRLDLFFFFLKKRKGLDLLTRNSAKKKKTNIKKINPCSGKVWQLNIVGKTVGIIFKFGICYHVP